MRADNRADTSTGLGTFENTPYMDDDFMTVCLADNFEGVELILRIVLGVVSSNL